MSRRSKSLLSAYVAACVLASAPAVGATYGMVLDEATNVATVFDADTQLVVGAVPISPASYVGDCAIDADQTLGYVTSGSGVITVIDLPRAALAAGIHSIPISNPGHDISLTPDGRYLLTCGGPGAPLSVVKVAARREVHNIAYATPACDAVDTCSDGSALIEIVGIVHRYTSIPALRSTGESTPGRKPFCAGQGSGLAIVGPYLNAFVLRGMSVKSQGNIWSGENTGRAFSGQANSAGDRVYLFDTNGADIYEINRIDVFALDPETAKLHGATEELGIGNIDPIYSMSAGTRYEEPRPRPQLDRFALSPYGDKAYVGSDVALPAYVDAPRLNEVILGRGNVPPGARITAASLAKPSGVCLPRVAREARTLPRLSAWGRPVLLDAMSPIGTISVLARLEFFVTPPQRPLRIEDRSIEFTTLSGAWLCRATTNERGYASCVGTVDLVASGGIPGFLDARYQAYFLGDRAIAAASTTARMVYPY